MVFDLLLKNAKSVTTVPGLPYLSFLCLASAFLHSFSAHKSSARVRFDRSVRVSSTIATKIKNCWHSIWLQPIGGTAKAPSSM